MKDTPEEEIRGTLVEAHKDVLFLARCEIENSLFKVHAELLRDKAQSILDMLHRIEGAKQANFYNQ